MSLIPPKLGGLGGQNQEVTCIENNFSNTLLELGNTSNVKWFDGIGEYKINWGAGYRIYLAQEGKQLIILFGGGTKKKQQADIDRAKKLYQEYKERKKKSKKKKKK